MPRHCADLPPTDHRATADRSLLRDREPAYAAILAAEAPYLEVARAFGLRVGRTLTRADGVLVRPRFDREIADGKVVRCPSTSSLAQDPWQIPRSIHLGAGTIAD